MTTKQYLAALKQLGLSRYGPDTREALGLSRRQLHRLAAGDPVNSTLGRLIKLRTALKEMLEAHSLQNIGLEASKRRLEAIKQARLVLEGYEHYIARPQPHSFFKKMEKDLANK